MSFLAPLFLLGALAVALPVLFHLIRRTTREKTPFSSLMFLLPTPPRVTQRSRLDNIWLLLLRCLVVGLLALSFSRPFIQKVLPKAAAAQPSRKLAILLDTSASMRRAGCWEQATAKAAETISKASPADDVMVLSFDRTLKTVVSFSEWSQLKLDERVSILRQRLAALKPSWAATHLGPALVQAGELFDASGKSIQTNAQRQIVLISDFQEGAKLDGLQGHEWPRGIEVILEPVQAKNTSNAGLQWLAGIEKDAQPAKETEPRFRVVNSSKATMDRVKLQWRGEGVAEDGLEVYVPAGQSRVVPGPKPQPVGDARLVLSGDGDDFDNTVHVIRQQPARLPVLFLGNQSEADPAQTLYYLLRAFPPTQRQIVEVLARKPDSDSLAADFFRAQLAIAVETLPDSTIASLQQFAREGKTVLLVLQNPSDAQSIGRLLGTERLKAQEAGGKYALLANVDFQHPLFAAFSDPRFSDFTKIHFWKHRQIDAAQLKDARVLARFDDGDPALIQVPLGKGSVMILTSGWQPADSQLALSSKFVPLLHSLLEISANLPPQKAQYFVGEEVPLPPGQLPLSVIKPDGTEVKVPAGGKFMGTDAPGFYTVNPIGLRFAVNLAPDESKTTPMAADLLQTLGVPLKQITKASAEPAARQQARAQADELEGQQKLWRWLIVAALIVLLVETWLAARLSARGPTTIATTGGGA